MSLLGSKSAKKSGGKADKKAAKAAAKAEKQAKKDAAKKAGKQAAPAAARGVVVEKPKADIYTVLIALSFVAVLIACIMLSLEMSQYDWEFTAR